MSRRLDAAVTRRDWVRIVGGGAAGLALGCGDNLPDPRSEDAGAIVLEPSADALLISVWCASGGSATVELEAGSEGKREAILELGEAGTGQLDITGLAPDRAYTLYVTTERGHRCGPYRARTAPRDDDPRAVRIAISADFDPEPIHATALVDHLLAAEPELFISLGDFPYTDNGPDVAMTVPAYRDRHVALRVAPNGRRLLEGVGIRAIYDDHEFRNDWDAYFATAEPDRYAAAMQVWDEFFPVRSARGDVRYRRWRWGQHVECFLLDCRRFRSANGAADDPLKTMLGPTQEAWLIEAVRASTATFKLVLTSVPLDFGTGNDHWATFTVARKRLLDALVGIPGILFLSADQHFFAAYQHAHGAREFQVGPIARGIGGYPAPVAGVLARHAVLNVGLLDIAGDGLTMRGLGADGRTFYTEVLTADMLTLR